MFPTKYRKWIWLSGFATWVGLISIAAILYNGWYLPGPHGPFHWVGMDFVPYWVGVRSMLAGQSPYSDETTRLIQMTLLGGVVNPGQDPMMFVYPPLLFLPLLPLVLLPLQWAISIWVGTILFLVLLFLGYISYRWGENRPWRMFFWWIILLTGALPYISISATKGQLGIISMAAICLAQKWSKGNFIWAGVFLSLSLIKPNVAAFPVLFFMVWVILGKKIKVFAGFIITLAILFLASWIAVGNWIPDYLNMMHDSGGAPVIWSYSALPAPWNTLYFVVFFVLIIYAFRDYKKSHVDKSWFSASVLPGMALLPMRWIYDLAVGFLTLMHIDSPRGWKAILVILVLCLPWILSMLPEPGRWQAMVVIIPLSWSLVWVVNFVKKIGITT